MIRPDKQKQALYCLHLIAIWLRSMAAKDGNGKDVTKVLDYVERLPWHIASNEDMTDEFRSYIEAIAKDYPWGNSVLEKFDSPSVPDVW